MIYTQVVEEGEVVKEGNTISNESLLSPHVWVNPCTWIRHGEWQPLQDKLITSQNGVQPLSFSVADIDIPLPSKRWMLRTIGDAPITFDDLRSGNMPLPTEEELKRRHQAIESAKEIRGKIDIRPLTTSAILRNLRNGKSK